MKKITLLFYLLSQIVICQTREFKGTVTDSDKIPIIGATIKVKNSSIETISEFDGDFIIKVPDSLSIISISYLGYVTKEIDAKTILDTNTIIVLDEDVTQLQEVVQLICFSHPRYIRVSYFGGIKNSGSGFLFEYADPYLLKLPFIPEVKIGHQTNFSNNLQTIAQLNLKSIFRLSRNDFDIDFAYRKIRLSDDFNWRDLKLKFETNFKTFKMRYTAFSLGLGSSTLNFKRKIGIVGGFQHYLFNGVSINSEITKWQNLWQLKSGVSWIFRNFSVFYEFNSIEKYSEHNIGLGYTIYF